MAFKEQILGREGLVVTAIKVVVIIKKVNDLFTDITSKYLKGIYINFKLTHIQAQ